MVADFVGDIFFDGPLTALTVFFMFSSVFIEPIVFINMLFNRRKIVIWEFGLVIATWCLVFYVAPTLRT